MGEQDDPGSRLAGGVGDQAVTGGAGGGGQAGRRLLADPGQAAPVGARLTGRRLGEGGPSRAVGAQAVVDGEGDQATPVTAGPVGGDPQQGDGIAASRQSQGQGRVAVALEPAGQAGAGPLQPGGRLGQPGLRAGVAGAAGAQAKRVRISVARVRSAEVAPSA